METLPPPTKTPPFPIETAAQRSVLGVALTFAILPVVAVTLRVIARRIASRALDASDYCTIIACIFAVALEGVSITGVLDCGIGYDHTVNIVVQYGMGPVTQLLKLLIPLQFLWALSLGFSKTSILLLYSNVFAVPIVIWTARSAIVFISLGVLATIITGCLICQPFAMNWDQTIPGGHCGDQVLSFTVTGALNLVTDSMVLLLPLPYLYKLQMRLYKKLVLMGVFSVGLLTCVVSAIRIHTLSSMDFTDITYSIPPANIFSGLEPSVAVILSCIPLLRPLLGRGRGSSDNTGYNSSQAKTFELQSKECGPFVPLGDDSSQYQLRPDGPEHTASVHASKRSASSGRRSGEVEGEDVTRIKVRSQCNVETAPRSNRK
ncbi:hypothetical protein GE09DRAFT_230156 [Coniochaeta sp. 2T2.1]|nr:hypothetical protein GE09DRAFT_230156 [Coniochaeta sp. 2T2.1]